MRFSVPLFGCALFLIDRLFVSGFLRKKNADVRSPFIGKLIEQSIANITRVFVLSVHFGMDQILTRPPLCDTIILSGPGVKRGKSILRSEGADEVQYL